MRKNGRHNAQTRTLAVLALLSIAACANAEDWATYRHDNRRSGVTGDVLAMPMREAWKVTPPGGHKEAWQGPARRDAYHNVKNSLPPMRDFDAAPYVTAAGGMVAFGSTVDDSVHCLDAASGRELWTFTTDGPVRLPPAWAGGKLYFGSDDGCAYAVTGEGKLAWRYRPGPDREISADGRVVSTWPVRTGVMVEGERAYLAASLAPWEPTFVCAVDAATGREAYRQSYQGLAIQGALLTARGKLLAMQGKTTPAIFTLADGKPAGAGGVWGSKRFGGVHAAITTDGRFFYTPGPTGLAAYTTTIDAAAGRPAHNPPAIGGVTRFVLGNRHEVFHVRGHLECSAAGAAKAPPAAPGDDKPAAEDSRDQANPAPTKTAARPAPKAPPTAAAAAATQSLWRVPTPMPYCLILTGNAVVAGFDGRVVAYALETGKVMWESLVPGKAHGLAVADRRLFVSTDEGSVQCFTGP